MNNYINITAHLNKANCNGTQREIRITPEMQIDIISRGYIKQQEKLDNIHEYLKMLEVIMEDRIVLQDTKRVNNKFDSIRKTLELLMGEINEDN
jgi:hypothetical protein